MGGEDIQLFPEYAFEHGDVGLNIGAPRALMLGVGRSLKNWRLWGIFYALNFLFAAVLALPFVVIFMRSVSKSLVGTSLLSGFSYRWYVEFMHANGKYFSSLFPQVVLLFALYMLVEAFLAGGFLSSFAAGGKTKLTASSHRCAPHRVTPTPRAAYAVKALCLPSALTPDLCLGAAHGGGLHPTEILFSQGHRYLEIGPSLKRLRTRETIDLHQIFAGAVVLEREFVQVGTGWHPDL